MKLLEKAINVINKLEEGVGEVPPQVPSPGNVSYYQSVDEDQGEWGPWDYSDGAWRIEDSELNHYGKDPWGRPFKKSDTNWETITNSEGEITSWETMFKGADAKTYMLIVWND